jgi:hypothetical protein
VEDLECGVEREKGDGARQGGAADQPDRAEPDAAPGVTPGPGRAAAATAQPEGGADDREGDRGCGVEAREDGADISHVDRSAAVSTGRRRPDVEPLAPRRVVEDRVRDRSQVVRSESGLRRGARAALFKGDPGRVEIRHDRQRHDDERRRQRHGRKAEP